MTTDFHTPITTGAAANAAIFNSPLSSLDTAVSDNRVYVLAHQTELASSRGGYGSLGARLDAMIFAGGNVATLTDGAASAGQKIVDVDSTTGFVAGAYVAYALDGGALEYNLIDEVTSSTRLTMTTNLGTGGIADDTYISMISTSEYQAANAINHGATALTLPEAMEYAAGGVYNVVAYGVVADSAGAATANAAALNSLAATIAVTDGGATGDYAATLLFPPGDYYIDDAIVFASLRGARIIGSGHATRILWQNGTNTKNMLEFKDCRNCEIGNFYIAINAGACNAAIKVYGTAGDGVPRHNRFYGIMADLGGGTGASYGVQIGGASPATNSNNDFMLFQNCELYNYLVSGVVFVSSSQAYNYLFENCSLIGDGANSQYAVDCGSGTSVGGFSFIGGGVANHTVAAFRIANTGSQPIIIQGVNEEANNRFLVASSYSQIEIKQCRLSGSGVNADKTLIHAGGTNASLVIDNCIIGDGTSGGTTALLVAKVAYGNDANSATWGRFVFTNNTVYSTLDGSAWDDWPFDNSGAGYILPTEASNNLVVTDIGTLVAKRLDPINNGGVLSADTTSFVQSAGAARIVKSNSTGPASYATFANVPPYHIFTMICTAANVFYDQSDGVNGDNLYLSGGTNWTAAAGENITFFHDYDNDRFLELSRTELS